MSYLSVALVAITLIVGDILSDMGLMTPAHDRPWDFSSTIAVVYAGIYFIYKD